MSTEIATNKEKPLHVQLGAFLERLKPQMSMALPKHLTAERMARLTLTAFNTQYGLNKCTFESIAACVMTASQLGLEIGVGGQAYMIPYGDKATFVPGWRGLIDLNSRAARSAVWTGAVFAGDHFEWELGDSPRLKHRPCGESDPNMPTHAYAVGRINGTDFPIIECWPNERLHSHRDKFNKVGTKHYSYGNWEMYCRKVVLLQVLKYLPASIEMHAAIELNHAAEDGRSVTLDANFVVVDEAVANIGSNQQPASNGSKTRSEPIGAPKA